MSEWLTRVINQSEEKGRKKGEDDLSETFYYFAVMVALFFRQGGSKTPFRWLNFSVQHGFWNRNL